MVRAQALALGLDVGAVGGDGGRRLAPIHPPVASAGAGVRRGAFEQRAPVPGGAEEGRGRARAGGHGAELAVEPVLVDVLRLVGDEADGGGVPGHAGLGIGAEKDGAGAAHLHGFAARAAASGGGHERVGGGEGGADALGADAALRVERGRADDERSARARVGAQQAGGQRRGDLVLARLARHHDGERGAAPGRPRRQQAAQHARLVAAQGEGAGAGRGRFAHGPQDGAARARGWRRARQRRVVTGRGWRWRGWTTGRRRPAPRAGPGAHPAAAAPRRSVRRSPRTRRAARRRGRRSASPPPPGRR